MSDKITYTSGGSSESFHTKYEEALRLVASKFGSAWKNRSGGEVLSPSSIAELRTPIDTRILLGTAECASREDASRAVEGAHRAYSSWRRVPWQQRVRYARQASDQMADAKYEIAVFMAYETGKNRLEAMGEVEESVDLIRYYCDRLEEHAGYVQSMKRVDPRESTESNFRPYGAWGVISPFNFPLALSTGMITAALITGNTVVFKPSLEAAITGYFLHDMFMRAGVPEDVFHVLAGHGDEVGSAISEHPLTAGLAFTGSYSVGMKLHRSFSKKWPKPLVLEMGGKNPAIVAASADLDFAAEGIVRSAFGYGGQKCSACSRAFIERPVYEELMKKIEARTRALVVGNPLQRDIFLGPVIDGRAKERFGRITKAITAAGGKFRVGGKVLVDGDFAFGHYVEPTVAEFAAVRDDPLFFDEHFLPLLFVSLVDDLSEALALANRSEFGLTAGLFSREASEVERFLDEIEAGVVYVNRRTGATTGAWPGINPFGGWKGSGSTGPAGLGPHYLLKFMREQSRTVNP